MANHLPTPLAAAIGVVPALLSHVLRLPGRAVQLPVIAVSNALATMDALRTGYDDLAQRGEHLVARLRGQAAEGFDAAEDRVEDVVARTPFAGAYDKAEDALEDAAEATERAVASVAPLAGRVRRAAADTAGEAAGFATGTAEKAAGFATDTAEKAADVVTDTAARAADAATDTAGTVAEAAVSAGERTADTAEKAADAVAAASGTAAGTVADAADSAAETAQQAADDRPAAEAPKGVPTPKATEPDTTRVDSAASPSVQQTVEAVVRSTPAAPLDHDDLPLPDYDHMTLGSLRGRLRSLSLEQLVQIRTYEKAHADRLPIVTMLDNRIAKLSDDPSAAPTGPVSTSPSPEQLASGSARPSGGIDPTTTTAPKINPPSHGDPTNPAQPR